MLYAENMIDIPSPPGAAGEGAAGFKTPEPVKAPKQGEPNTQTRLFRPGGSEPAAPASIPKRTIEVVAGEYADLIEGGVEKNKKKLDELRAEIDKLRSDETQQAGKGSLEDLPEWVKPNGEGKPPVDIEPESHYVRPKWMEDLLGEPPGSPIAEVKNTPADYEFTPDWQGDLEGAIKPPEAEVKQPQAAEPPKEPRPPLPKGVPAELKVLYNAGQIEVSDLDRFKNKKKEFLRDAKEIKKRMGKLEAERQRKAVEAAVVAESATEASGAVKPETLPAEEAAEAETSGGPIEPVSITTVEGIESDRSTPPEQRAEVLSQQFTHNRDIAIKIIQTEVLDTEDLKHLAESGRATVDELRKEYGKRKLGLQESTAVENTRKAKDAAEREMKAEERVLNKFYKEHSFDDEEVKGYQTLVQIESRLRESGITTAADLSKLNSAQEAELFEVLEPMTREAGVDTAASLRDVLANWEHATQAPQTKNRYKTVKAFEVGGATVKSGKTEIKPKSRIKLENTNKTAKAAYDGALSLEEKVWQSLKARPETDKRIKELATYLQSLRAGENAINIGYMPDRDQLEQTISNLDTAHIVSEKLHKAVSANRVDLTAEGRGVVTYNVDGRLTKDAEKADKAIKTSREGLSDLIDPAKRMARFTEFASILPLAQQENPDISRLSPQDRARLAVAQALLGITPSIELVAAAPEPAPPPADQPPEEPPEVSQPPATERTFTQMTGVELNALSIEGLRAISSELTPDQVASLPLNLRSSLEQEGLLSANQYGKLPVVEDIAKVADQLERVQDNQVAGQLKKMVEAAGQKGEEALQDIKLLVEESLARVAAVISSDSPADADQPMMHEGAKAALEKNLTSPNKTVAARAKTALKLLGAAGLMALMASNTGGEQH